MRPPRISYANVVSTIALFIALGGVSWAAASLPKNSVGTRQLKKNAVTGSKVKDGSLSGSDFAGGLPRGPEGPRGLTGESGPRGETGAKGDTGAQGLQGPPGTAGTNGTDGTNGVNNYVTITTQTAVVTGLSTGSAFCPPGTKVLGGGASLAQTSPATAIVSESYPIGSFGWTVQTRDLGGPGSGTTYQISTWAICAEVTPAPPT